MEGAYQGLMDWYFRGTMENCQTTVKEESDDEQATNSSHSLESSDYLHLKEKVKLEPETSIGGLGHLPEKIVHKTEKDCSKIVKQEVDYDGAPTIKLEPSMDYDVNPTDSSRSTQATTPTVKCTELAVQQNLRHHKRKYVETLDSDEDKAEQEDSKPMNDLSYPGVEGTNQHVCNFCGKIFKTKEILKRHRSVHSDIRPFQCDECSASFKRKDGLKRHLGICYDRKLQTNGEGGSADLKQKMQKVGDAKDAVAEERPEERKCESQVWNLGQEKAPKRNKCGTLFLNECEMCDAAFTKRSELLNHVRIGHRKKKVESLEMEDVDLSVDDVMGSDSESTKDEKKNASKGESLEFNIKAYQRACVNINKLYTCEECGKCLSSKTILNRHKLTHSGKRPFGCDDCDAAYTRKFSLARHVRNVHENKKVLEGTGDTDYSEDDLGGSDEETSCYAASEAASEGTTNRNKISEAIEGVESHKSTTKKKKVPTATLR